MKLPTSLLMLTALAGSGTCLASNALLELLDSDGNGYLTLEETQNNPQVYPQFSQIDRDQNNRLEAQEMQLVNIPPSFSDFDTDENAAISPEEAGSLRLLQNEFSELDENADQTIDPGEFAEFSTNSSGSG